MIYLTDKHFFTFSLMNNSQRHIVVALSSFIHSFIHSVVFIMTSDKTHMKL